MATSSVGRGQPRDSPGLATSHKRTIGRTRGDEDPREMSQKPPSGLRGVARVRSAAGLWRRGDRLRSRRRSAGPASEVADDLVGGVSLEGVVANVVAVQDAPGTVAQRERTDAVTRLAQVLWSAPGSPDRSAPGSPDTDLEATMVAR